MRISQIILENFRSFGPEPTTIYLEDLSVFIGTNSTGKTAAIQALSKMFSPYNRERLIEKADFHSPLNSCKQYDFLSIEVIIQFPELENENHESIHKSIPPFFYQMTIDSPGSKPYVRMRLEAKLLDDSSVDGDIEQNLYFIQSPIGTSKEEEKKIPVNPKIRSQIQLLYIPATRDPSKQLKNASSTILGRILRGINWPSNMDELINENSKKINDVFTEVEGVKYLINAIKNHWFKYHKDSRYREASLDFNHSDIETILEKVEIYFEPTEVGSKYKVNQLGDGLQSLFYFTLVNSLLEIENIALREINDEEQVFKMNNLPALTILAIEEPENHISPHLLGRVMGSLKTIVNNENSQVIVSTHSPAMVKRVDPNCLSHFRIELDKGESIVTSIKLPDDRTDEYKYVKAAVKAYPELYFSQLVILGEGDSEEIIIPKIIELLKTDLDESSISVVPLGGRHVNHFWKLLNDLNIPHLTLLDLDLERNGGGWGRIKYVIEQLLNIGVPKEEVLHTDKGILNDEELSNMHKWDYVDKLDELYSWVVKLEKYGVYFSQPLDIDFMMLELFLDKYKKTIPKYGGPRIDNDKNSDAFKSKLEKSIRATLKKGGGNGDCYTIKQQELMIWYNYFFLGRGKPSTHIMALEEISEDELSKKLPNPLKKLLLAVEERIKL